MATKGTQEEFEALRQADIQAYEAELAITREGFERARVRAGEEVERLQALARENGFDLGRLHSGDPAEDEETAARVAEMRQKLLNRPSPVQEDLRIQALYTPVVDETGGQRAELMGAVLLAPDAGDFEGIEGEQGNPWLVPTNTDRLHIGQKYSGAGTGGGCWGIGYIYSPTVKHVYFSYTPKKSGYITAEAWIAMHGFWIAKAPCDGCFTCKETKVYASVGMASQQGKSFQYGPEHVIVDIQDDGIDKYKVVDHKMQMTTKRLVYSGSPVHFRISAVVGTRAKGSGSYAEVNFKDKASNGKELNYIYVPCVVVYE